MSDKSESMKVVNLSLDYPVELEGGTLSVLNVRRPTLGDHLEAEKQGGPELNNEARLFARLCKVNPEDLGRLDMADYKRLQEIYKGFLQPLQTA